MKLRDHKYWYTSGAFTLFEKLSLQIFRFGGVYLLVRYLPKAEYGIWLLFLAINAFLEVARLGLIRNALVKFLASNSEEHHAAINTASILLNFSLTLFSISVLYILSVTHLFIWPNTEPLHQLLYLYMITTFVLTPFYQFNFIQQANFDFRGSSLSNIAREGLFFGYVVYAIFFLKNIELINLGIFQIVAAGVGSITAMLTARPYWKFSRKIHWDWIRQLFHFGKYTFGTGMSTMLMKNLDQFMLGALLNTSSVAIYGIGMKIANLAEVPTQAVADVVFPQSAKRIRTEGKEAVKYLYERSVGVILALVFPGICFILLFPEFIVELIAGDKYADTVPVLQIVMLYGIFIPYIRQFGTVFDSIGMPKLNFYFVIFSSIVNIICNYVFITKFGTIGAAYGTLVTLIITFAVNQVILYQKLGVQPLNTIIFAHKFYVDSFSNTWLFLKKAISRS